MGAIGDHGYIEEVSIMALTSTRWIVTGLFYHGIVLESRDTPFEEGHGQASRSPQRPTRKLPDRFQDCNEAWIDHDDTDFIGSHGGGTENDAMIPSIREVRGGKCKRWSSVEDERLKDCKRAARTWADICLEFPDRSHGAVQARWSLLSRKRSSFRS
ncbi:hypothetical protein LTS18_009568, partial [Coniosporium uncinatum]